MEISKNYFRCGFRLNTTIEATVRCIQNDRVLFSVTNLYGEEYAAWFYIHGERINPYQVFNCGTTVLVRVMRISKDTRRNNKTVLEVRPETLPVDDFLDRHPLGSLLRGRIEKISGSQMIVCLADNVFCMVRRVKFARTGMPILCRLKRYNANRKMLFAAAI